MQFWRSVSTWLLGVVVVSVMAPSTQLVWDLGVRKFIILVRNLVFFSRGNRMAIYGDGRWATFCPHWTVDSFGSCLFPTLVTRSWLISSFWKTFPIYSHGALDSTDLSSIQGVYHIWTMKWPRSSEISLWFSGRTSERGIRKFRVQFLLGPVVRRPISTNPRLNFNRVVYFFVQELILDYVPHSF